MKTIAIALSAVMFVAVVALSQVDSLTAQCASSNSASLEMRDGSLFVSPDGTFFYTMNADWDTKATPFVGVVSTASGSIGVEDVTYSPSYFFPESCSGRQVITVIGRKVGNGPHAPNHLLELGPAPNNAITATATLIP